MLKTAIMIKVKEKRPQSGRAHSMKNVELEPNESK